MRVLIAGSSGFLGQTLSAQLRSAGHDVLRLVRRQPAADDERQWDPAASRLDGELIDSVDAVINLAGSPLAGNVHSKRWAEELVSSRVQTTSLLATTIAESATKPAFLAGNGISYYGDHGADVLTEQAQPLGDAFLPEVTRLWQSAADPAVAAGARVVILRTAPVLDQASPPLKQLRLLFRTGLGGRIGNGRQYFPIISARDWTAAVTFALESDLAGPVNLCCTRTPTNAEFTAALAEQIHRPAVVPVPSPLIRVAAGRMAPELLGSLNTVPQALLDVGFEMADPDVAAVIRAGLAD